jgi:cytosine/uracil/thiamine/allantoin permease
MIRTIVDKIAIPSPPECTSKAERRLATEDLLPVVPYKRQWTSFSYVNFWIADSFSTPPAVSHTLFNPVDTDGSHSRLRCRCEHFLDCRNRSC